MPDIALADLRAEHFAELIGKRFKVEHPEHRDILTLEKLDASRRSPNKAKFRDLFSLFFKGESTTVMLNQHIHPLENENLGRLSGEIWNPKQAVGTKSLSQDELDPGRACERTLLVSPLMSHTSTLKWECQMPRLRCVAYGRVVVLSSTASMSVLTPAQAETITLTRSRTPSDQADLIRTGYPTEAAVVMHVNLDTEARTAADSATYPGDTTPGGTTTYQATITDNMMTWSIPPDEELRLVCWNRQFGEIFDLPHALTRIQHPARRDSPAYRERRRRRRRSRRRSRPAPRPLYV